MNRTMTTIGFCLVASAALAQAPAPAKDKPSNAAVSTSDKNNVAQPAPGANSFTEEQAKSRIVAKGYTDVSALTKDADGIWRGKAKKGSASQDVAVDFQGNVFGK